MEYQLRACRANVLSLTRISSVVSPESRRASGSWMSSCKPWLSCSFHKVDGPVNLTLGAGPDHSVVSVSYVCNNIDIVAQLSKSSPCTFQPASPKGLCPCDFL